MESEVARHSLFYQCAAVLTGVLLAVSVGMQMGWPSPSLPLLLRENSKIPTTSSDGSWMVAIPFIAQPFGSLIAMLVINRIGRKTCILLSGPLFFIYWLIVAYASNLLTLQCSRILAGLGTGIVYTALPMYIGEVSDKRIRGLLGCSIQAAAKLGILLINVIGLRFDIRVTALISTSVPVLHFITFSWMPESPHFLIMRKNNKKAATSLKMIKYVDQEISELSPVVIKSSKRAQTFLNLFTKKVNRRALGIILGLRTLEHLSGFYAIMSYSLMIFNEAGGFIDGSTATIIYAGMQLIISLLSCAVVDKIGRRPLLILSVSGSGCALLIEGIYFYLKYKTAINLSGWGFVSLSALLLYTSSYCIGLATIPMLMMAEILPTDVKAHAVGIGIAWFAIVAVIVSKFFQILKDEYGSHVPFFIFAMFCVFGLLFVIYYVPETKGKTLEQIQLEAEKPNCKSTKRTNEQELLEIKSV